jgi:NAD(P)-dependent dehydrogenase (short-subunit alcohol dehydrogenase family)
MDVPAWGWFLVALGGVIVLLPLLSWILEPRSFPLKSKVVVITGGSAGIGRATAKLAARRGAHVAILARRKQPLEAAEAEVLACRADTSQRVTTHSVDVCNEADMEMVMRQVAVAHGGAIDVLVACAGTSFPQAFEEGTAEQLESMFRLNVMGCRHAAFYALPFMEGRPAGGRIVFVSSQVRACERGRVYGSACSPSEAVTPLSLLVCRSTAPLRLPHRPARPDSMASHSTRRRSLRCEEWQKPSRWS